MKLIRAGSFKMGGFRDPTAEKHRVTLSRDYYLATCPVTEAQWTEVLGGSKGRSDCPVTDVTWHAAVSFCRKLSALPAERSAGRVYRLPTEAEWEYACRAGTTTKYSFGDDKSLHGDFAWFRGNSGGQKHPVGQKKPNPWGLYDMHGNVFEWCSDWYGLYGTKSTTDPPGPDLGMYRVMRGGSWGCWEDYCYSGSRSFRDPLYRKIGGAIGFRLTFSPSGASSPKAGD